MDYKLTDEMIETIKKDKRIKDEKKYAKFEHRNLRDKEYIKLAKEMALELREGKEIDEMLMAKLRLGALDDRGNLKGDFVLLAFNEAFNIIDEHKNIGKGRTMILDEKLTRAIFVNEISKQYYVKTFCEKWRITDDRYHKIKNVRVKQEKTIKAIERIRDEVEATRWDIKVYEKKV